MKLFRGSGFWVLSLVFAVSTACGTVDGPTEAPETTEWRIDSLPEFEVGGHDDRPEYTLFNVASATRLGDGRVVVANSGTSQLRYYGPDGTHLFDGAGEGGGPGELRFIFDMARGAGDTLVVFSRDPGLTWYDPEGQYVRSERRNMFGVEHHPCRFGEGPNWRLMPDATLLRLLVDNFAPANCPPRPEGPFRTTGLLGIPSPDGERFDTIAILPATERVGSNYRVFGHDLLLAMDSAVVFAGNSGSDSILALGLDGDTLKVLPNPFESRPVPEELKDEGLREVRQSDGSTRFVPGFSNYPDLFPPYARLLVDVDGFLWVMQYPEPNEPMNSWRFAQPYGNAVPEEGASWRVLGPDGLVAAELITPPGLFPLEIGRDYILGLSHDEFDVETVKLYRLHR